MMETTAAVADPAAGMLADPWVGGLIGVGVAAVSAVISWYGIRMSAGRPQLLIAAVLGGTLARLVLVGAATAALLVLSPVHVGGYVTGLVGAYLVFLAAEIVLMARRQPGSGG